MARILERLQALELRNDEIEQAARIGRGENEADDSPSPRVARQPRAPRSRLEVQNHIGLSSS